MKKACPFLVSVFLLLCPSAGQAQGSRVSRERLITDSLLQPLHLLRSATSMRCAFDSGVFIGSSERDGLKKVWKPRAIQPAALFNPTFVFDAIDRSSARARVIWE